LRTVFLQRILQEAIDETPILHDDQEESEFELAGIGMESSSDRGTPIPSTAAIHHTLVPHSFSTQSANFRVRTCN
jgi:hypothetical protein